MKLKILAVVEEAVASDLIQGDILTFIDGERDVITSIGDLDGLGGRLIEFESGQKLSFYHNLTYFSSNDKNVTRIERWIEVPYNMFDEGQAPIDCSVILGNFFDKEEGGLLAKQTGEDQ